MIRRQIVIIREKKNRRKVILIAVGVILVTVLIILLAVLVPKRKKKGEPDRIECPGFASESTCKANGCRYERVKQGPWCHMGKNAFGYTVQTTTLDNSGITQLLKRNSEKTPYGESFPEVKFELKYVTENIIRFKLTDALSPRYEVPVQEHFKLLNNPAVPSEEKLAYDVTVANQSQGFQLQIKRKADETMLWDTSIGGLLLSDQFLQIASYLPSENIYGLGEHVHERLRHDMRFKTWPMFSRDRPPEGGQTNLYGVHPFYTCLEKNQKSHGVLLLNSNAMEATLMPAPAISFRTIGGVLDFFIFVGDNPEHVVQLYTSLVGRPIMPPYWGLGFQLSRYGYNTLDNVAKAINRTKEAGIAQAVQFLDIDHFDANKDFTYNQQSFKGLPEYMSETKKNQGLKWIIILDPAIPAASDYAPYEGGKAGKVYIERSPDWSSDIFPEEVRKEDAVYGKVWPAEVAAFPDFFRKEATKWWSDNIVRYRQTLPFDGLWIDMNEPANFGTNEERPFYCDPKEKECWSLKCPKSKLDDPPYNPLLSSGSARLSQMTLCMDSVQRRTDGPVYKHYDVHSLYGWSQSIATAEAAQLSTGTRSLVISRSTYPSSGQFCGHWLGDNKSTWKDMRRSVIGMLEFNLFGIPYIGADVCGFFDDTTPELCKRWMQLGAFYPFYRNHNGMGQKEQDPAALGEEVKLASKRAVERRVQLNPYLYTLFFRAHVDGNTVIRPLFHEFPGDEVTWDIDTQFMWGKSLLITPVLEEGAKSVSVYLPKDDWWYFQFKNSKKETVSGFVTISDVSDFIPIHVRGGTVLPLGEYSLTPSVSSAGNMQLYVFPKQGKAFGELFEDDGFSQNTIEHEVYSVYTFEYSNCSLMISKQENAYRRFESKLESIVVFGVKSVKNVFNGDETLSFTFDHTGYVLSAKVEKSLNDISIIKWSDAKDECQMLE